MKDPARLLDISSDPFERALLESAQRDQGSSSACARCVLAASASAVIASHAAASTTASGIFSAAHSAALATSVKGASTSLAVVGSTLSTSIVLKVIATGVALGLGLQGALVVAERARAPESVTRSVTQKRPALQSNRVEPPPDTEPATAVQSPPQPSIAPEGISSTAVATLEPAPKRPVTTIATGTSAAMAPRATQPKSEKNATKVLTALPDHSLDREVQLLDAARRSCASGGYDATLSLLDRHQSEFAGGALGPEALVIRVQALLRNGQRAEAEKLAGQYIMANPISAVSKRLRAMLRNSARSVTQ